MEEKNWVSLIVRESQFSLVGLARPQLGCRSFFDDFLRDFEEFCQLTDLGFVQMANRFDVGSLISEAPVVESGGRGWRELRRRPIASAGDSGGVNDHPGAG